MAPGIISPSNAIYSATYSNVPVFEYNCEGEHVMRRRQDNFINATHILKVANFDKPARTRILEREVQKGVHEKIQGGYGKYQGTWVPLKEGRNLAERNHVLEKLRPIFDFVPGDISPPPAPKHTTNASSKPRVPKPAPIRKIPKPKPMPAIRQVSEEMYDNISAQLNDDESMENSTLGSASYFDEDDHYNQQGRYAGASRKRKRIAEVSNDEQQHMLYADGLLDYFMLSSSDAPLNIQPPQPPDNFQVDKAIDDQNHTALQWAAAMGDIPIMKDFMNRGANTSVRNDRGETPLIRAVLFTNNWEKETMPGVLKLLQETVTLRDNYGGTILHHAAMTTSSHSKKKCARYYMDVVLNHFSHLWPRQEFARFIDAQDKNGDTTLHIVARHGAKRCIRTLQGHGAAGDIPNNNHETADRLLQRSHQYNLVSSSPVQPDFRLMNGQLTTRVPQSSALATSRYESQSAQSFSESFDNIAMNGSMQVTLALETEAREKEAALGEGNLLVEQVDKDRHQVRQETYHLMTNGDLDDDEVARLKNEYEDLKSESESINEQIQHRQLHQDVRAEEQNVHHRYDLSNGEIDEQNPLTRIQAAQQLSKLQTNRRDLTRMVAEGQATAGMSEKGEAFKRLISSTTGLPEENVGPMAPELLEELETSKMEGAGTGGFVGGRTLTVI